MAVAVSADSAVFAARALLTTGECQQYWASFARRGSEIPKSSAAKLRKEASLRPPVEWNIEFADMLEHELPRLCSAQDLIGQIRREIGQRQSLCEIRRIHMLGAADPFDGLCGT